MPEPGLRGAIVWAIVPYVPEAPFRLWLGADQPVAKISDARRFADQARRQGLDAERTFLVEGKLRPVVLIQDRPRGVLKEIVALQLVRLETLSEDVQASIREQRRPSLFHLPVRTGKYGLSKEMAINFNALLRVHATAILPRAVGRLDDDELRVVGERLAEHLDIDLEPLITRKVQERLEIIVRRETGD